METQGAECRGRSKLGNSKRSACVPNYGITTPVILQLVLSQPQTHAVTVNFCYWESLSLLLIFSSYCWTLLHARRALGLARRGLEKSRAKLHGTTLLNPTGHSAKSRSTDILQRSSSRILPVLLRTYYCSSYSHHFHVISVILGMVSIMKVSLLSL